MTPGYAQWEHLERIDGNVLLVVNSLPGRDDELARAHQAVHALAGPTLHIIAPPHFRDWIAAHAAVSPGRLLFSVDEQRRELELNYFLETVAFEWVSSKQFSLVAGTAPHSLYNDTVHTIFEQRVALLLRDGMFLAHALPERGVYLFDGPALVQRFGRQIKVEAYKEWCRALIDDLHREWTAQGEPGAVDNREQTSVKRILAMHLGSPMLAYDERGAVPFPHQETVAGPVADFLQHLHSLILDRDVRLAEATRDHSGDPTPTRRSQLLSRIKRR